MKQLYEFVSDNLPTKNCHASTVLPLKNGNVIVAWFGGTKEGKNDVDIWYTVRTTEGFGEIKAISKDLKIPHWNPVLFEHTDGRISLYFKVGKKIPYWKTYESISTDVGNTFSAPKELVKGDNSGGRGPVKNKCIRLSNGRILAPASYEHTGWNCFIDISDDDGKTWKKSPTIKTEYCNVLLNTTNPHCANKIPMIQPTLWESEQGKVHAFTRTSVGKIYRTDSNDYGETWCQAYATHLPNNNSGIDIAKDNMGNLYLISNPVGENWGERSPLTIQISRDNGKTFKHLITLEEEKPDSEFSYPAIVWHEGALHISYTYERTNIVYRKIEL